ncbi:diacylglycerol kinase family protein [uncultured Erythrobacter sp.]|uniref:diacylglycerol/lipid kinase family protein n=1 Tax=uncultured Erythrobacter sp. TaxID=263913 RepID=UPI00262FB02A|nr:acylglycerol kinase family protein [uncultured Erythrobacter sp.]
MHSHGATNVLLCYDYVRVICKQEWNYWPLIPIEARMASRIFQFAKLPQMATPVLDPVEVGIEREPGDTPRVGVIYNPRSHGNKGADFDCGMSPQVFIAKPGDRSQLPEALAEFASQGIDLLVINGGDGTVRDVLTSGASIFGDNWPALAVLPKGKTNALTVDLGVPKGWSLQEAIDAFEAGSRVRRRPIEITPIGSRPEARVLGFILGAGAFTTATTAGQSAHKLGAFNSMAVAAAIVMGVAQWFFASRENAWRRGSKMTIGLGVKDVPMEHSGVGDPEWRQLLFASTLQELPAGMKPFGKILEGLKLAVTDQISRRSALTLIKMMRGETPDGIREKGFHQLSTSQFSLRIDDSFILDGEAFPPGEYRIGQGPELEFVAP